MSVSLSLRWLNNNPQLVKSEQASLWDGGEVRQGLRSYVNQASDLELLAKL